jgi:hypothetical protein
MAGDVGPVVDVHTHLALSYVRAPRVDLARAAVETRHYLPLDRPLDLGVYINKNLTADDRARLGRDLTFASLTGEGMRATHTVPNLAREMQELGITTSFLLPIDFPALSRNAHAYLAATRGRADLLSFGSVHPYAKDMERRLDEQKALGARGIKVHPAVQLVPPENHRAVRLYRLAAARALPVLIHCGPVGIELAIGRRLTQVARYRAPVERCPDTTFILGHSGALQMEEALALAKRHANVWLEVSCQSLANVRRILAEAPADRILFGTDWPFYHQAIGLAKVLIATEGRPALRRAVLQGNAARLFRLDVPPAPA